MSMIVELVLKHNHYCDFAKYHIHVCDMAVDTCDR